MGMPQEIADAWVASTRPPGKSLWSGLADRTLGESADMFFRSPTTLASLVAPFPFNFALPMITRLAGDTIKEGYALEQLGDERYRTGMTPGGQPFLVGPAWGGGLTLTTPEYGFTLPQALKNLRGRQEAIAHRDDWTGSGGPPVPKITQTGSERWQYLDLTAQQQEAFDQVAQREGEQARQAQLIEQAAIAREAPGDYADEESAAAEASDDYYYGDTEDYGGTYGGEEDEWHAGGPVIKRRGSGETATSPLAAGSFVDKPLYDRAVDTSPTYRRW
jgi:hypothetical protein